MRVPQLNERVKEAPAQALRAMFASIGQLLLFTDKLRNRSETEEKPPEAIAAATDTSTGTAPEKPAEPAPVQRVPEARTTTKLAAAAAAAVSAETLQKPAAAPAAPASTVAEEPAKAPAAPAATTAPAAAPASATGGAELPLANYDDLTVASLRARLRNLTSEQLTELIGYEKAHANRADIIAMFERRIAKLAEG